MQSPFAHVLRLCGEWIAFSTARYALLLLADDEARALLPSPSATGGRMNVDFARIGADFARELVDIEFLVPQDAYEALLAPPLAPAGVNSDVRTLYLVLTDDCNLRCKYCYAGCSSPSLGSRQGPMNPVLAERWIDAVFDSASSAALRAVMLHGGEPLLNRPALRAAVLRTRLHAPDRERCALVVTTNGTLLEAEDIAFFRDNLVDVVVSIDGPPHVHDSMRASPTGTGSSAAAISAYMALRAADVATWVSATVDVTTVSEMPSTAEWLVKTLGAPDFSWNYLLPGGDRDARAHQDYATAFAEGAWDSFVRCRALGVPEGRTLRLARAITGSGEHSVHCNAVGHQIVVAPNGAVGPCQALIHDATAFSNQPIDPDAVHRSDVFRRWASRSMPSLEPQCSSCVAHGVCSGGCAANAIALTGSEHGLDETYCTFARLATLHMLSDMLQRLGGEGTRSQSSGSSRQVAPE